jgi:hypothetical protein
MEILTAGMELFVYNEKQGFATGVQFTLLSLMGNRPFNWEFTTRYRTTLKICLQML